MVMSNQDIINMVFLGYSIVIAACLILLWVIVRGMRIKQEKKIKDQMDFLEHGFHDEFGGHPAFKAITPDESESLKPCKKVEKTEEQEIKETKN